jgi:hypothetical protein
MPGRQEGKAEKIKEFNVAVTQSLNSLILNNAIWLSSQVLWQ